MRTLVRTLHDLVSGYPERGQGLAEYTLVLVLVATVAIIALVFLGGQVSTRLSSIGNNF